MESLGPSGIVRFWSTTRASTRLDPGRGMAVKSPRQLGKYHITQLTSDPKLGL